MKTVSTQPNKVDDNRKKDTKPHPTGKAGNSRDGRLDKTVKKDPPPSRSRTTDNHTVPEWPATADPSIAEKTITDACSFTTEHSKDSNQRSFQGMTRLTSSKCLNSQQS